MLDDVTLDVTASPLRGLATYAQQLDFDDEESVPAVAAYLGETLMRAGGGCWAWIDELPLVRLDDGSGWHRLDRCSWSKRPTGRSRPCTRNGQRLPPGLPRSVQAGHRRRKRQISTYSTTPRKRPHPVACCPRVGVGRRCRVRLFP